MELIYKILSRLPSKKGQEALDELLSTLRSKSLDFTVRQITDDTGTYFFAECKSLPNKHIVTAGDSLSDLEQNIKDAIFTAFHIPARYVKYDIIKSPISKTTFELQYATV